MRRRLIVSIILSVFVGLISFPEEVWSSEEIKQLPENNQVQRVLFAESNPIQFEQWHIGLDTILVGKMTRDYMGVPQRLIGLSAGMGIGYRRYFRQAPQLRGLHPYWEIGTFFLLLPYAGVGVQYSFPLGDCEMGEEGVFSVGAGVYLFLLMPAPAITLSFSF